MNKEQLEALVEEIYKKTMFYRKEAQKLPPLIANSFDLGRLDGMHEHAIEILTIFEKHGYKGEENE